MSISKGAAHRPGIYYGWIIVAVALVSMAFWLGIRSSFSVFYGALLDDFHWSRAGSAGVTIHGPDHLYLSGAAGGDLD